MTEKKKKKLRDWSRSSTGVSPAEREKERLRQIVADGLRQKRGEGKP